MLKKRKLNITDDQKVKCNAIIHSHAAMCGGVGTGMAQIPLADNAVITPIQIAMIIELGVVFNQDITKSIAQSILSGASASLIGRGVSQVLWGWIPGVGNAINTATAAGLTEAIGWMAADRFSKEKFVDDSLNSDKVNQIVSAEDIKDSSEGKERKPPLDDIYGELSEEADLFISGEKIVDENKAEYDDLIKKFENEMRKLPQDHPLSVKYGELNEVLLR